jgi:hypothetical protein
MVFFLGGGGLLEVSGRSPQPPSAAIGLVLRRFEFIARTG